MRGWTSKLREAVPMEVGLRDNGGRRSGRDRRQFSYTGHIPERRSGNDRRGGLDRRNRAGSRKGIERRAVFAWLNIYKFTNWVMKGGIVLAPLFFSIGGRRVVRRVIKFDISLSVCLPVFKWRNFFHLIVKHYMLMSWWITSCLPDPPVHTLDYSEWKNKKPP